MAESRKRVIAISGCKGGVGKTVIAVNLALTLTQLGQRVVLVDGNLSVPDVKFTLGLNETTDDEISYELLSGPFENLDMRDNRDTVKSGSSQVRVLTPNNKGDWKNNIKVVDAVELIQGMDDLFSGLDTLIVDTAPGLAPDNITLIQAATEVVVVISQEDVSIIDAARQIKLLYEIYNVDQFYIVVNLVGSRKDGANQFEKLQSSLKDEKQVVLIYLGAIPQDKTVSEAAAKRLALLSFSDDCRAAKAFQRIGYQLSKIPVPEPKGRIEFFLPGRIKERA